MSLAFRDEMPRKRKNAWKGTRTQKKQGGGRIREEEEAATDPANPLERDQGCLRRDFRRNRSKSAGPRLERELRSSLRKGGLHKNIARKGES